jgi:aminoglycoside phosphotransferase (APT) family kinase protein
MAGRGAEFIGTMQVQEKHRFDIGRLESYLASRIEGFRVPLVVEQFRGGQSNPTYRLTDARGERYVLRRKPPGKLLPSAHAVDREFRVISALNRTDVPTPRAYVLCEDEALIGTPFYVMEYCDGRVLWDALLPDVPAAERAAYYRSKVEAMAKLHRVDPIDVGLGDFGRPGSYVARQISRWGKQYKASETERIPEMDQLLEWLPAHAPTSDESTVVHGDFRFDNMIYHATEPRVLAIIDWEISTLGDPMAELSYVLMMYRIPQDQNGMAGRNLAALGIPDELQMRRWYAELTGRTDTTYWEFYMAYNIFRVACIRQGVYARSLDGTASNRLAAESGKMVRPNAELAWSLVERIAKS